MRRETWCVHEGTLADAAGGINSPVFPSTAFAYLDRPAVPYQRYFNTPNQQAVVRKVAALEGAEDGVLFGSGMAAITTTLLALLRRGDHAVLQGEIYGGTRAFVAGMFEGFGIDFTFAPPDAESIAAAATDRTRVVFLESPTNPLLRIVDLRQVARQARRRGALTVVDNTFATPILQNPLALGADLVVHSGTKYLGGHSDLQCGITLGGLELAERIRRTACHLGGSLNAPSCALLERSLKTLHLRVERATENAGRLAPFLARHPAVAAVHYPGLPEHPGHNLAKSQMRSFGAMLSFDVVPDIEAEAVLRRLRLIRPAVSLGGVETTICAPVGTSHAKVPPAEREALGITKTLLRLSVGIEHADDLAEDLDRALRQSAPGG